ncbi:SDR family oxidoreductase [Chitinimonas koreensis]|uniref:SDR family oxidoreductase n=1 Tax=Chitinimonas koreensis TaxID=356302 RepID=UPI00041D4577|nr:SDR family oxidoreductase [Chitinimonas koreensis]QNM96171.1 SDR family oxidoreductase [Chitinimonas koreensis]
MTRSTLSEQTVVVIGGGSGIGRAVAAAARADGAAVIVAGREGERLAAAAAGLGARAEHVDVTERASLDALFGRIGDFDHLVLTVGPQFASPKGSSNSSPVFAELDVAAARAAFDVKFWGQLEAAQAALGHLRPGGSITLTSGLLSRRFSAGSLVKSTMNAAAEALAKSLARELAPLRVNVVSPGVTDTEAWHHLAGPARDALFERIGGGLPVGRVGRAEEIAAAYLLAMRNGFMTGAVLDVEGGGLL